MGNVGSSGVYGRHAGVWKEPADVQARSAGVWANASEVYARTATGWVLAWERNAAPGPVAGLAVDYTTNGTTGWNARATWTLPGDLDLATVWVRWTLGGTVGAWSSLAAGATTTSVAVASGATVSVDVYVRDTGALDSPVRTASGGTSPLHAVPTLTMTQVGLDRLQVTWTHPPGAGRSGYTLVFTGGHSGVYSESAGTTTRTVVASTATTIVTVTPMDTSTGTARNGRSATTNATASAPAPTGLSVSAWTYSSVSLAWTAPAWADYYDVERATGGGAWSSIATVTSTTYTDSTVLENTQYRYRVRAMGTTYASGWSSEVRPSIGRAAYTTVLPYSLSKSGCNIYQNVADGPVPPANVATDLMTVDLSCTFATSVASGTSSRSLSYVANNTVGFGTGTKPNPWQESFGFGTTGGGLMGVIATGTGWSTGPTGGFRLVGTITVSGTQTTNYPAVPNGYW